MTGRLATACPHGVNIVSFFAFSQLIMAPAYQTALAAGANVELLSQQIAEFKPKVVGLAAADKEEELRDRVRALGAEMPELVVGDEGQTAVEDDRHRTRLLSAGGPTAGLARGSTKSFVTRSVN